MDQVIMPELITPKFAEVIAENPEVLKIITDHQPGEKVIMGQDCSLECSNPTNVKLILCNVTIGLDETEDECNKGCGSENAEKKTGGYHIKISGRDNNKGDKHWGGISDLQYKLRLEMAVLEAKKSEAEKILKLIPRQIFNRKLVARCKREILEAKEQLAAKRTEL